MSYQLVNKVSCIKSSFFCMAFATIMITGMTSCLDDEPEPIVVEHYIDNRLRPYFNTFKEEAQTRGIDIDFRLLKIDGYIQVIPEQGVAGQCQTNTNDTRAVVVQPLYWDNIDELDKEFLIFHELGHCVLKREHFDNSNPDGTCVSMMNSGGLFCDVNYNRRTRDKYIDELFSK